MIRFIAAVDSAYGIADEHGIPWQGKIPADVRYYHDKIRNYPVLMGYGVYVELSKPMDTAINYVASQRDDPLREGFTLVKDAVEFLEAAKEEDIWVLGGAILFAGTLHLADELYLTQLDGDFNCTKFFPAFKADFSLTSESDPITENGVTYRFQIWTRNKI